MIVSKYILDVLKLLLDGDENGKAAKLQIPFLSDAEYEYTNGGGVFVSFLHLEEIFEHKLTKDDLVLNGVTIVSPELKIGADATVFLRDGIVDRLEIWSFDGNYPDHDLINYTLKQVWHDSSGSVIEASE
ncbi:hypothetical protein [Larkinella sp. C7]|jgi:hypothetical protein|uniref:hypothetical protein n=1 Tax=Larkinella sp. C7 TaxID=2576607 RepID=UPI0011113240|nr:hypothetical protein [Larkinella sp. C7]